MSIQATGIQFQYAHGPTVLHDVTCRVKNGLLTAIIGPNGSGKSTLIRLLAGLRSPQSGDVAVHDRPISSIDLKSRANQIAFIEQRPQLAFDFKVHQVVLFGGFAHQDTQTVYEEAIRRFELQAVVDLPYGHLSIGQQQRVSLARAWVQISTQPNGFLLADEPCSAMDPKHVLQTMLQMKELTSRGVGVGMVMHDLNTAIEWADEVIILNKDGRIECDGPASESMDESVLSEVFEVSIHRYTLENQKHILVVDSHC